MILVCLALLQSAGPTVGDTLWVESNAHVPFGHIVRLPPWEPTGDVELLGTPRIIREGDSVTVRYPVVAWRPGSHSLMVPGPELIAPDGTVESGPSRAVTLEIVSVLPDGPPEEIPVKAESGIVRRPIISWIPLAVLLLAVAAMATPLWWWWLRRGPRPPPPPQPVEPSRLQIPIEKWSAAGEHRAVLAAASDEIHHTVASHLEELPAAGDTDAWVEAVERKTDAPWDGAAVVVLLRDIDQARFRPEDPEAVLDLYRRAQTLAAPPGELVDQ
jgi:hypothetical protein